MYEEFVHLWHRWMLYIAAGASLFTAIVYIGYLLKLSFIYSPKRRYDMLARYDRSILRFIVVTTAVVIIAALNMIGDSDVSHVFAWFFIRLLISLVFGSIHVYIFFTIINVYYPKVLAKKLERLRYTPRVNPKTGNTMKLLSEEEEDVYLEEGMQAEENVFSVDYDVWIDEETGDTIVEKYQGHLRVEECDNCGFQTLKLKKEEVVMGEEDQGEEVLQHFECSYCGRTVTQNVSLHRENEGAVSKHVSKSLTHNVLYNIRLEIHTEQDGVEHYDFQTIQMAKAFLDEYGKRLVRMKKEETT